MKRREFIQTGLGAVAAGMLGDAVQPLRADEPAGADELLRMRFGVNYTPSRNWWFCWNDWEADAIRRDLDGIAQLGADHLRILLIWPFFQPNPQWISPAHLARLDQLLYLMGERKLDALVTVFTGQLSGWHFLPVFNQKDAAFYTSAQMWTAQELFVRELSKVLQPHPNFMGFDLGNELNTCWQAEPKDGDAWMNRMLALMHSLCPGRVHINGVDHQPWLGRTTFSQENLVARQPIAVMHCYPHWTGAVKYGGPMDPPSIKLLAAMATLIRAYARNPQKPVWAGEFNTCIEALDENGQAAWLEKATLAAMENGVSWFTYWDSHDVSRQFDFNSLEYSLGLMTNARKVKVQGRMFKQLAETYRGKMVKLPTATLPPPPTERTFDASWRWMLDWMHYRRG